MRPKHIFTAHRAGGAKPNHFIIAKSGKPITKIVPLDAPSLDQQRRVGF